MRLTQMMDNPTCLNYLERYVNCGSPSGFTKNTTSPKTAPTSDVKDFCLKSINIPKDSVLLTLGYKPASLEHYDFLIHPDMANKEDWLGLVMNDGPRVTPTSSGRTVRVIGSDPLYIKLHYDGLIGRIYRHVNKARATSAIEITRVITEAFDKQLLPNRFRFMRESYAQIILVNYKEWGYVVRDAEPYPHRSNELILIPAFSLFSKDQRAPNDPLLIDQLVELSGTSPHKFVIDGLIEPMIDAYFTLLRTCGLQLELQAQNTLFTFDTNGNPRSIIARDAESIDKDISLIENSKLPVNFTLTGYKEIRSTDYNYQIMHSFMFDFKMGEYVIEPLIRWLEEKGLDRERIQNDIKKISNKYIESLPSDFLPSNCWYSYGNEIFDNTKRRPYIKNNNLKFR